MTRAEEATQRIHNRAILEAEKYRNSHCGSIIEEVAYGRGFKAGFIEGYEQAEKDLSLTWGDVQLIDHFILQLVSEEREGKDWGDGEKFYTEVLNRFNKSKEEK